MSLMSVFHRQLLTLVSLVLSKLRAKLGLKPLEVNAVKKGECGAEDWGEGDHRKGSLKRVGLWHRFSTI